MNTNPIYSIPENTPIRWRNVQEDLKLRDHITEIELVFDEIKCRGDGGSKLYFELGPWLVLVEADDVVFKNDRSKSNGPTSPALTGNRSLESIATAPLDNSAANLNVISQS